MVETQYYQPIALNTWPSGPDGLPDKSKFQGSDLDVQTFRWEFRREPGSGGANEAQDFNVPAGRVLVEWNANETSCIRCGGGDYQLVMKSTGTRTFPIGIRPGSRLEPGGLGGPGASFTGGLSLISVPLSVWIPVANSMIPV